MESLSQEGAETEKSSVPVDAAKTDATPVKKKKINAMSLDEINIKLKDVKEKMGSHNSKYAEQLLARKSQLTG